MRSLFLPQRRPVAVRSLLFETPSLEVGSWGLGDFHSSLSDCVSQEPASALGAWRMGH